MRTIFVGMAALAAAAPISLLAQGSGGAGVPRSTTVPGAPGSPTGIQDGPGMSGEASRPDMGQASATRSASPAPAGADAAPRDAQGYVAKAGAGDLYEIQSSQLAEQKAASGGVRQFGQMMIQQHQMTTQRITQAARAAGLNPPPPALEPRQQAMIQELRGLSGRDFDAAYLRQQRTAHDEALALHQGYARNGDNAALRAAAEQAVPIVQHHIEALRAMPEG